MVIMARLTLASRQDSIKVIMATRTNSMTIAGINTGSAVGVEAVVTDTDMAAGDTNTDTAEAAATMMRASRDSRS